jgi:phosphoenolpyruvate carboxykinase (ATP)
MPAISFHWYASGNPIWQRPIDFRIISLMPLILGECSLVIKAGNGLYSNPPIKSVVKRIFYWKGNFSRRGVTMPRRHVNLSTAQLIEHILARQEGVLASNGAISVNTGKYTGRSPNDKFFVKEPSSEKLIHWGPNRAVSEEVFDRLHTKVLAYLEDKAVYEFNGFAVADSKYRLPIKVTSEFAWQILFSRNLFIVPSEEELNDFTPEFQVLAAPGFKADPKIDGTASEAFIIINFAKKMVLIGGTMYAGEIKKSVFTVLNFLLPQKGILPMHCSANMDPEGNTALFFGLSGTGKTTLSADPDRYLIGDDEHGWGEKGVFNFEGGCYAKCINLSFKREPQIWNAIRFGAILENVILNEQSRIPDYDNDSRTENTRAAYPIAHIDNSVPSGLGNHPDTILFLTADAFGVLPPIARISSQQAMYQFLSGYTSKLAGTERGITQPEATFSTCFGAPFLPMNPTVYADMLGKYIDEHNTRVFLVNTGWTGGSYGVGERMSLKYTRAMVKAALNGDLDQVEYETDPIFGLSIPKSCPNVPNNVLNPRNTWANPSEYDQKAMELAKRFIENFAQFQGISPEVHEAGPKI